MSTYTPAYRHDIARFGGQPLLMSNDEVYGLMEMIKVIRGLDGVALTLLAGKANPDEVAAQLPAMAQLQAYFEANGWGPF